MRYVVIVDRTVDPQDPRVPLVFGPFRREGDALVKCARVRRGLERADLDRDIYVTELRPGSTSIRDVVEDAV